MSDVFSYLVQQAKLGVVLLWVLTAWVWVLLHQEHIPLFTLKPPKSQIKTGSDSKLNIHTFSNGVIVKV
jgi:hypothetical protein